MATASAAFADPIALKKNTIIYVEKHRGFGFVEFIDPADAAAALENLHDSELYGRVIKCNLAKPGGKSGGAIWAGEAADAWYGNQEKSADTMDDAIRHQEAKGRGQ